ncbi:unnamed protein product, partial [Rhizoctonia solani]
MCNLSNVGYFCNAVVSVSSAWACCPCCRSNTAHFIQILSGNVSNCTCTNEKLARDGHFPIFGFEFDSRQPNRLALRIGHKRLFERASSRHDVPREPLFLGRHQPKNLGLWTELDSLRENAIQRGTVAHQQTFSRSAALRHSSLRSGNTRRAYASTLRATTTLPRLNALSASATQVSNRSSSSTSIATEALTIASAVRRLP